MHLVGTNICVWIRTLGKETLVELRTNFNTTSPCAQDDIMSKILANVSPYLYPFIVEYSLIGAAFLYVMWSNIGRRFTLAANGSVIDNNSTALTVASPGGFTIDNMSTSSHSSISAPSLYSCLGSSKGDYRRIASPN